MPVKFTKTIIFNNKLIILKDLRNNKFVTFLDKNNKISLKKSIKIINGKQALSKGG